MNIEHYTMKIYWIEHYTMKLSEQNSAKSLSVCRLIVCVVKYLCLPIIYNELKNQTETFKNLMLKKNERIKKNMIPINLLQAKTKLPTHHHSLSLLISFEHKENKKKYIP